MTDRALLRGDTLRERISAAMGYADISEAELARRVGVSRAAVNQWLQGKTKELKASNLLAIAQATGVAARWIECGEGPAEDPRLSYRYRPQQLELLSASEPLSDYELEQAVRLVRALKDTKTK